jgi:YfiH family protein
MNDPHEPLLTAPGERGKDPWVTPHRPDDTLIPILFDVQGVQAGISRIPVDAADRVAGRTWVARSARVDPGRVAILRQTHGALAQVAPWVGFPGAVAGDAMVTGETELALAVRVADCAPVVLAVDDGRAIGIVHAGWRGVREGVVAAGVSALCDLASCPPDALRAAIGPTIGLCCYSVGKEFSDYFPDGLLHRQADGLHLDLPGVVAVALEESGVPPRFIGMESAFCSVCARGAPDQVSLHSHRRSGGEPGRNIAFVVRESAV